MAISGIEGIRPVGLGMIEAEKLQGQEKVTGFGEFLMEAVNQVNRQQLESEQLTADFAAGKTDDINNVMITASKAELTLQFAMQVRNKILDAYNEIMRIQI